VVFLAFFPSENHFRPKNKVLVKQISYFLRNLKQLHPLNIINKIPFQTFKTRQIRTCRKDLHDSECHCNKVKHGFIRHIRDKFFKNFLQKQIGKRKETVCTNTVVHGKFHGYPALHSSALNNNNLRKNRRRHGFSDDPCQLLGKDLHVVTCIYSKIMHRQSYRDLCKTPLFAQFLRQSQILILEILNVFLWLKFLPFLNLNKN